MISVCPCVKVASLPLARFCPTIARAAKPSSIAAAVKIEPSMIAGGGVIAPKISKTTAIPKQA